MSKPGRQVAQIPMWPTAATQCEGALCFTPPSTPDTRGGENAYEIGTVAHAIGDNGEGQYSNATVTNMACHLQTAALGSKRNALCSMPPLASTLLADIVCRRPGPGDTA